MFPIQKDLSTLLQSIIKPWADNRKILISYFTLTFQHLSHWTKNSDLRLVEVDDDF